MRGHNICFIEEILKIIPKLSRLLLLIWSPDDTISCQCRTVLAQLFSGSTFRRDLMLALITTSDWLDDVTSLCHNTFAKSASWNKAVFPFHLCWSLFALKSFTYEIIFPYP